MAMIKCKECGEKISTKAETCPNCGAKVPKKTSLFTWVILIFIGFIIYAVNQVPSTSTGSYSKSSSSTSSTAVRAEPPKPTWRSHESKDKMTGKKSSYASSPTVKATRKMKFPYSGVTASLSVGCDNDSEWVYFNFSQAPNLTDDETKDGYNIIRTRIKWNKKVEDARLKQIWGATSIHFYDSKSAITNIIASNSVLLELQWHGSPGTYFEFPLRGSSAALKKIRKACSKY